ncbi:cobalamin biosynthesis protein CobQ [Cognatishimia sp.]|uniref:cobalamin biosynthesis protein CobQ n=1 Tax=Cognatishimia sp. TaxID=2211648 RepID=UPI0035195802
MNTPAHILIGWAAFARKGDKRVVAAAILGGLAPDLSLYLLAGVSLFIVNIPANVVFGELYFSPAWQTIFSIDNSFIVWGILLGLALYRKSAGGIALCAAAILHLVLDFPLHHDDGRAHFWPLSSWIYESPVSYWDRDHHAGFVAPVAAVLATVSGIAIIREDWRRWRTVFVVAMVGLELFGAAVLFGAALQLG